LARVSPLGAGLFVLLALSLIGVPPLPGFWAKLLVLSELVVQADFLHLLAAGVILAGAVLEVSYLFRVASRFYHAPPDQTVPVTRQGADMATASLLGAGLLASVFALALVAVGVMWYHLYVRHRVDRVGAVAKVAERVAERLLAHDAEAMGLDKELREILKEKGLRREDPFGRLVQEAGFVEIPGDMNCENALRKGCGCRCPHGSGSRKRISGGRFEDSRPASERCGT